MIQYNPIQGRPNSHTQVKPLKGKIGIVRTITRWEKEYLSGHTILAWKYLHQEHIYITSNGGLVVSTHIGGIEPRLIFLIIISVLDQQVVYHTYT
jgi:hypothetical protein